MLLMFLGVVLLPDHHVATCMCELSWSFMSVWEAKIRLLASTTYRGIKLSHQYV